jgi:hypothetical protein
MKFLKVVSILLLFCCSSKKQSSEDLSQPKAKYFRESFIKKFKKLDLPCSVEHNPTFWGIPTTSVDVNSMDTLFFSRAPVSCYGMASDTSNFFTLFMYMHGAITPIPMIVTFDKSAEIVSAEQIDYGCWSGGGPCDYTCSGGYVINKDLTISLSHEITVTDCIYRDSADVYPWKETRNWKGKINKNGKIEIEDRPEKAQQ